MSSYNLCLLAGSNQPARVALSIASIVREHLHGVEVILAMAFLEPLSSAVEEPWDAAMAWAFQVAWLLWHRCIDSDVIFSTLDVAEGRWL